MTSEEVKRAYEVFSEGHHTITSIAEAVDGGNFDSVAFGIEDYLSITKGYIAAFEIISDLKEKLDKTVQIADLQNAVIKLSNTMNKEAD